MAEAQGSSPQGQDVAAKLAEYEKKFQEKDKEIENYKKRVAQLEDELAKAQKLILQSVKESEEVDALKSESEKTLTKAKSIIFERTKVIKNQELQIEAYNQQIESLKDVIRITKDLLEIRNLEVKQLEGKINCMEERMKGEKERQDLLHKKLETMIRHNGELKREYETQLCLFSALRERYNERELARGVVDTMTGRQTSQIPPAINGEENATTEVVKEDSKPDEAQAAEPLDSNSPEKSADQPSTSSESTDQPPEAK
ncbi:paramyosin [Anoplophora glabripennis]|uniref:paramyosin n=1 Tax=Anoplophora glabripennis TaxID=217634 RepID=UPI000873AD81|nr:paramyosin [Anoplophora glabripennis]